MTPQEKAEELVNMFNYGNKHFLMPDAKQCAMITIYEILEICSLDCITNLFNHEFEAKFNYWQEVKQEIENL